MRITKFGHACVRIEHDGQVVVIDPGAFTEREAVDGATAVLITHEHPDHLDVGHLGATDAPIFTIDAVRRQIAESDGDVAERVTVVSPGEQVDVGLPVTAVGEMHAVIHDDLPRVHNSGYVVDAGGARALPPRGLVHPARRTGRRALPADARAVEQDLRGHRLRPLGGGGARSGRARRAAQRDRPLRRRPQPRRSCSATAPTNGWSPAPTSPSDRTDERRSIRSDRRHDAGRSTDERHLPARTLDRTRLPRGRWRRAHARPRGWWSFPRDCHP